MPEQAKAVYLKGAAISRALQAPKMTGHMTDNVINLNGGRIVGGSQASASQIGLPEVAGTLINSLKKLGVSKSEMLASFAKYDRNATGQEKEQQKSSADPPSQADIMDHVMRTVATGTAAPGLQEWMAQNGINGPVNNVATRASAVTVNNDGAVNINLKN